MEGLHVVVSQCHLLMFVAHKVSIRKQPAHELIDITCSATNQNRHSYESSTLSRVADEIANRPRLILRLPRTRGVSATLSTTKVIVPAHDTCSQQCFACLSDEMVIRKRRTLTDVHFESISSGFSNQVSHLVMISLHPRSGVRSSQVLYKITTVIWLAT